MLTQSTIEYFYKRLGVLLKEERKRAEISQETLSDYLGLSRVSVVNIEKGKQKVQVHTLIEIIKFLKIPSEDFLEKLVNATNTDINQKLEKKLQSKVGSNNKAEIVLKEFISYSKSKTKK